MARAGLRSEAYIKINGKEVLFYEREADGTEKWHLPKAEFKQYEACMLANLSKHMSEYVSNNPDCSILNT